MKKILKEIIDNYKYDKPTFFIGIIFLLVIIYFVLGHFHLIPEAKAYYGKIYAFPDEHSKNYYLKARIKGEQIERIYFYNGGSLAFEDCEDFNIKGESFHCSAIDDERYWTFKYYGEKIK